MIISRSVLLRMRNGWAKSYREIRNINFMFNNIFFFFENHAVYKADKFCRVGQATDDNIAHAHGMLANYGYKYMIRISNIIVFFHCNNNCTAAPPC